LSFTPIRNILTVFWAGAGLVGKAAGLVGVGAGFVGEAGRSVGAGRSAASIWVGIGLGSLTGSELLVGDCSIPTLADPLQAVKNIPMRIAKKIRDFMVSS
jgi:hypothetical protein